MTDRRFIAYHHKAIPSKDGVPLATGRTAGYTLKLAASRVLLLGATEGSIEVCDRTEDVDEAAFDKLTEIMDSYFGSA